MRVSGRPWSGKLIDKKKQGEDYFSVDLTHIFKTLVKRFPLIVICGIVAAAIGFMISAFLITPTYSSYVKLYVNNSSLSIGSTSISLSDLTAAQSLVKTYGDILMSRTTLERVAEKSGADYTWKDISGIVAYSSNNDTELMKVTVTSDNPYEAAKIANTIAEVLPTRISEIIDGASMRVVDTAIPDLDKVAPSVTGYTAVGLVLGVAMSTLIIAIFALLDDTVHDEEYVLRTYDYPILGRVPDLTSAGKRSYGYYYQYRKKGTGS